MKACAGFVFCMPIRIRSLGSLLDTIAAHDNICSYIDVPLQHASAGVLKRMKRGGGADCISALDPENSSRDPGRDATHFIHCRLSGRDRKRI